LPENTANVKNTIKKALKYIISVSMAVVLLWFSFRGVEWADFMEGVKSCRWEFILLSMAAGAFAFFLRALRWRQLLLPVDPSVKTVTVFNGVNIGNISNFVFPRIGEFVRCGVIVRRSRKVEGDSSDVTYDKVLGTVVLERGWELLVMLIMLAIVVVGGFDRFGTFFLEQIWTPMSMNAGFSLWWILVILALVGAAAIYAVWKFREQNALCARIWKIVVGLMQGFSSCLRMEKKWLFFAYTLAIWMTYWLMAASVMWAAPFLEGLDMIDALFLSLVGGLGFAVPVPGGIGAFHFIIGLTLSALYGIPMEMGIVYATLSHTSQAITQIVFGAGSYIHETFANS
jgi:uncharacterized membrane protein YbhN (UPF0104 family)